MKFNINQEIIRQVKSRKNTENEWASHINLKIGYQHQFTIPGFQNTNAKRPAQNITLHKEKYQRIELYGSLHILRG